MQFTSQLLTTKILMKLKRMWRHGISTFRNYKNLIFHGKTFQDIEKAHKEKKTAIFFGFQNCSPIEDDIGLVEGSS